MTFRMLSMACRSCPSVWLQSNAVQDTRCPFCGSVRTVSRPETREPERSAA